MPTRLKFASLVVLGTAFFLTLAALVGACQQTQNQPASPAQPPAAAAAAASHKAASPDKKSEAEAPKTPVHHAADAAPGKYFEDQVKLSNEAIGQGVSAKKIVALLGDPKPYQLQALDSQTILIYCRASSISDCDSQLLAKIKTDITDLEGGKVSSKGPAVSYEITVPHDKALGDVAKKAQSLNFSALQIQAVGTNKIRVSKSAAKGITTEDFTKQLAQFEKDLHELAWEVEPESPVSRIFYIDAKNAAGAMGAKTGASGADSAEKKGGDTGTTPAADAPGADKGTGDAAKSKGGAADAAAGAAAAGAAAGAGKGKGKGAGAAPAKPGADKKSKAQPATDADKTAADDGSKTTDATDTSTSKEKPGGDGTATDSVAINVLDPDILVFSDKNPGDDSDIAERKRILAGIDFPRPEVIINTFSFQTSSSDSGVLAESEEILRNRIGAYNDNIEAALYRAWFYLQGEMSNSNTFFDQKFHEYLTYRFIGEARDLAIQPVQSGSEEGSTDGKNNKAEALSATPAKPTPWYPDPETIHSCARNVYCLGYTSFLNPLRPTLTDLLFAGLSSAKPGEQFRSALERMQGFQYQVSYPDVLQKAKNKPKKAPPNQLCKRDNFCDLGNDWQALTCDQKDIAAWRSPEGLPPIQPKMPTGASTAAQPEQTGQMSIAKESLGRLLKPGKAEDPHVFPMFCFRDAVERGFPYDFETGQYNLINLGLPLRAALANFLFQYKMSQQYPHEFSAYDLSQSAQELNSELNPLIVAFNRDLAAALEPLEEVASCDITCKGSYTGTGKTKFVNNGIITVRTVSGKETTVDTVTQNFFDATNPPSITDIITSVGEAESNIPKVLKTNLTANEAAVIIGALNSVKPTTAQVGRQFSLDILPRSLSGASSAELNVNLKTSDVAPPTTYSNGKSENDNLSHVASETVNTKVRLESIKLFEISSFTATLERSRHNFPLILPGVELPYIGSFVSIPVAPSKVFHRSTAIMSAVVVPTAADLASGVAFTSDRVWDCETENLPGGATSSHDCKTKKALSLSDFKGVYIRDFNKLMVRCFAEPKPSSDCTDHTSVLQNQ